MSSLSFAALCGAVRQRSQRRIAATEPLQPAVECVAITWRATVLGENNGHNGRSLSRGTYLIEGALKIKQPTKRLAFHTEALLMSLRGSPPSKLLSAYRHDDTHDG